jgi:hypothetical protein
MIMHTAEFCPLLNVDLQLGLSPPRTQASENEMPRLFESETKCTRRKKTHVMISCAICRVCPPLNVIKVIESKTGWAGYVARTSYMGRSQGKFDQEILREDTKLTDYHWRR